MIVVFCVCDRFSRHYKYGTTTGAQATSTVLFSVVILDTPHLHLAPNGFDEELKNNVLHKNRNVIICLINSAHS
jgi:hypothetical protein